MTDIPDERATGRATLRPLVGSPISSHYLLRIFSNLRLGASSSQFVDQTITNLISRPRGKTYGIAMRFLFAAQLRHPTAAQRIAAGQICDHQVSVERFF